MADTTFIDTRLFISVRPFLEYAIPETVSVVVSCLLGDIPKQTALDAVQKLKNTPLCKHDRVQEPSHMKHLQSHCMRVVNYAVEYVKQVEINWVEYMQRLAAGVKHEIRCIRRDADEAKEVYRRYRKTNACICDREYAREMRQLQRRVEDCINSYRTMECPKTERGEPLRQSTHELREAFASAYGQVNTTKLMTLRQCFESELAHMQADILESFCARCEEVLHAT
jgi:hypothetical protein